MPEPRKDTRKRDRAAYMRKYRAGLKKDLPTLIGLAARVAALEAFIASLAGVTKLPHGFRFGNDEVHVMPTAALADAARFGRPRPAPKGK